MPASNAIYDVASVLWQGKRPYQEDSVVTQFHDGEAQGFAIVADGMGGHAAGDVASNLVAAHGAKRLNAMLAEADGPMPNIPGTLQDAITSANEAIRQEVKNDVSKTGMGATMLGLVLDGSALSWGSVGDSPLLLFRDDTLSQLNEDHSMAPVIAAMVQRGDITPEQGKNHPDRNALTSVLMGDSIEKTDVPHTAFSLAPGDVVIAASDGLQFLENEAITDLLRATLPCASSTLASVLLKALQDLADPYQDNVAIVVVQLAQPSETDDDSPQTRPLNVAGGAEILRQADNVTLPEADDGPAEAVAQDEPIDGEEPDDGPPDGERFEDADVDEARPGVEATRAASFDYDEEPEDTSLLTMVALIMVVLAITALATVLILQP